MTSQGVIKPMRTTRSRKLANFALMAIRYQKEVGQRIKRLRLEKDWSQSKLAELTGVQSQTVSRWERGQTIGKPENLEKVAEAFDMTVGELMADIHTERPRRDEMPIELRQELDHIKRALKEVQEALSRSSQAPEEEPLDPNHHGNPEHLRAERPNNPARH